jgi:hypothetical protein
MTTTAKQLRGTAEALEDKCEELDLAITGIEATRRMLGDMARTCRERASEMDGKPLSTRAKHTGPKEKEFTL